MYYLPMHYVRFSLTYLPKNWTSFMDAPKCKIRIVIFFLNKSKFASRSSSTQLMSCLENELSIFFNILYLTFVYSPSRFSNTQDKQRKIFWFNKWMKNLQWNERHHNLFNVNCFSLICQMYVGFNCHN